MAPPNTRRTKLSRVGWYLVCCLLLASAADASVFQYSGFADEEQVIDLRHKLGLAAGDTVSTRRLVRWMQEAEVLRVDSLVVAGNMAFARRDTVFAEIYFEDLTFAGKIDWLGAELQELVQMQRVKFEKRASFGRARFAADFECTASTFAEGAWFDDGVLFQGNADFTGTTFGSQAVFSGVTFKGNALFRESVFAADAFFGSASFGARAVFSGARFGGRVLFDAQSEERTVRFAQNAVFNRAVFADEVRMIDVDFEGKASFVQAVFRGPVRVEGSRFAGEADFERAEFIGETAFARTTFAAAVQFRGARFGSADAERASSLDEHTFFNGTVFEAEVDFTAARFREGAVFLRVEYRRGVRFDAATFAAWSRFDESVFSGEASFVNSRFVEDARWDKSRFAGDLLLQGSQFHQSGDFASTRFGPSTQVYLENADFRKLDISWPQLEGRIAFTGGDSAIAAVAGVYMALRNNFENMGQRGYANACYFQQKRLEERYAIHQMSWDPTSWFGPFMLLFLHFICGFGVKPHYTLLWGLVSIVLFALAYCQRDAIEGRRRDFADEEAWMPEVGWERFMDALYFSVNSFTTVGHGDWYPTGRSLQIGKWKIRFLRFRTLAMIESIFGWLLMTLFVMSMTMTWL